MNTEQFEEYIQKLDISEPGLFVMKLKTHLNTEQYYKMSKQFSDVLELVCPGSVGIVLPPEVDTIHKEVNE